MILIGQYDSAFVRRVGITLRHYGLAFTHRPWSVFGDIDRLMEINPLGSVPVLVLASGTALTDSKTILDHLDTLAPADRRMVPDDPGLILPARRATALVTGLADRFVSLFYERRLHDHPSIVLSARREAQVMATLARLDAERATVKGPQWFGHRMTHADVALACVVRHLRESLPDLYDPARWPAIEAHAAHHEAMAVFGDISQPFLPPT